MQGVDLTEVQGGVTGHTDRHDTQDDPEDPAHDDPDPDPHKARLLVKGPPDGLVALEAEEGDGGELDGPGEDVGEVKELTDVRGRGGGRQDQEDRTADQTAQEVGHH